ncbi:hypothetical protein B0H13DRAFT_1850088 [Mycena leptocephala]|nr:hypothetical protein B0H13DRAFT_1850088 [Mycena leptocephala]
MWVLMTAHVPPGSKGKTIVTYDTDVMEFHNQSREQQALGVEAGWMSFIRQTKPSHAHDRVWQNVPVPGGQPYEGHSFAYTMNWLLGLVERGIPSRHEGGTLVYSDGFRQIKLYAVLIFRKQVETLRRTANFEEERKFSTVTSSGYTRSQTGEVTCLSGLS